MTILLTDLFIIYFPFSASPQMHPSIALSKTHTLYPSKLEL